MELLVGLATDSDSHVREAVATGLAAGCEQGGLELAAQFMVLLAWLAMDSEREDRDAAFVGLPACGEGGGPELATLVVEALAGFVKDSDPGARQAMPACCEQGGPELAGQIMERSLGSPRARRGKSARQQPKAYRSAARRLACSPPRRSSTCWPAREGLGG